MNISINEFVSSIKENNSTLIILNELWTFYKFWNYKNGTVPKIVIQLGREEVLQFKSLSYSGAYSYELEDAYKYFLDRFNAELEEVDKDSYIWIREKLC